MNIESYTLNDEIGRYNPTLEVAQKDSAERN